MIVLALDIAGATGACWDGPEGRPVFATHRQPDLGLGFKVKAFAAWLHETISVVQPDLVGVEAPLVPQRGMTLRTTVDTVRFLITCAGVAHYVAACSGVPVTERSVQQVKKHLTGTGRADKQAMMERCRQLGWTVNDDHQADAAALWALIHSERDRGWQMPAGRAAA